MNKPNQISSTIMLIKHGGKLEAGKKQINGPEEGNVSRLQHSTTEFATQPTMHVA